MQSSLSTSETNVEIKKSKSTKTKTKKTKTELSNVETPIEETNFSENVETQQSVETSIEQQVEQQVEQQQVEQQQVETEELNDILNVDSEEVNNYAQIEEYILTLDKIIESYTYLNNVSLKDLPMTKDTHIQIINKYKKIIKLNTVLVTDTTDYMSKENVISLKHKDAKQNKPKKVINKENMAINKLLPTYPEVLKFLKLEDGTNVSRALLIQKINNFVREEKLANNPDIYVEGNNQYFNLIGDLKIFFDFIKTKMIERQDLQDESSFPTKISYREIMKYLKYCFVI